MPLAMAWVGAAIDTTTISLCKSRRRGCSAWPLHAKAMLPQLDEKFLCPAERIRSRFPDPRFPLDLALLFCFTENSIRCSLAHYLLRSHPLLQRGSPGMMLLPPALHTAVADEGRCGPCLSTLQAIIARASSNPRHPKKYVRTSRIRRTNVAKQDFQKLCP
jgi:hypothetical protein